MSETDPPLHPRFRFPWPGLVVPAIFALLTLLLFNDALFDSTKVIADKNTDLALQFLPWRKFGFDQLRHFNLALWNPHIFGGAPYFAGFQSALLYPPNWLHLFMPVGLAINWINALHVFGAGMLTFAWCRYRGLSRASGILAGTMFMFCGPYFPHVYAGHLPHIAIMTWAPLLFLSIDMVMDGLFARGTLLGVLAMTMFLLAGHPQYVYYTGMAAAVYVLINLMQKMSAIPMLLTIAAILLVLAAVIWSPLLTQSSIVRLILVAIPLLCLAAVVLFYGSTRLALVGCGLIVVGGVAIAAVQLMSGMDFVSESVRSSGTKYDFSASFSFPPENLLTLISPDALGPMTSSEGSSPPDVYFGRCYLWEVSMFVSATGMVLAIYGACTAQWRMRRGAGIMVLFCFLMALGAHTPAHRFLYDHLPGFASFRGSVKFNYLVALFLSLLAACGFDRLLRAGRAPIGLLAISGLSLILVLTLAFTIQSSADEGAKGIYAQALRAAMEEGVQHNDVYFNPTFLGDPALLSRAATTTAHAMFVGSFILTLVVIILVFSWLKPGVAYALVGLTMVELVWFAGSTRQTMNATPDFPRPWAQAILQLPEDTRVLDATGSHSNFGLWYGYDDVWGYDPGVLKRYAELVAKSQGIDPEDASQYVQFHKVDRNIFSLLRVAAVLTNDSKNPVVSEPNPMPLAQIVSTAFVTEGRDRILSAMESDSFDPRRAVMLESAPSIKPAGAPDPGTVKVMGQTTDSIELDADVNANAILLVTNAYSKGWHVRAIDASSQDHYDVLPGDWALQAIPLMAGKHHLMLEYRPTAFVVGRWISVLGLFGYVACVAIAVKKRWSTNLHESTQINPAIHS